MNMPDRVQGAQWAQQLIRQMRASGAPDEAVADVATALLNKASEQKAELEKELEYLTGMGDVLMKECVDYLTNHPL